MSSAENYITSTLVGTDLYPHMPILCMASTLADLSDFWLLGEQSSPKCEILCPGCRWAIVWNFPGANVSLIMY